MNFLSFQLQVRSLNTLSHLLITLISTKNSNHQRVTSRLSASSVTVWIGIILAASKWLIHLSISSSLSVVLVDISFTHRRYCLA